VSNPPKNSPTGLDKFLADELDKALQHTIKQINTYLHSSPSPYRGTTTKYQIDITYDGLGLVDDTIEKPDPINLSKVDDPDWDL
jgi:hypothetical protein